MNKKSDFNYDVFFKDTVPLFLSEYYVFPLTIYSAWLSYWFSEFLKLEPSVDDSKSYFYIVEMLVSYTFWIGLVVLLISVFGVRFSLQRKKQAEDFRVKNDNLKQDIQSYRSSESLLKQQLDDNQQELFNLRGQHQELLYDSTSNFLRHLAEECCSLNDKQRISLYLFSSEQFILVGRYSKHPEFKNKNRMKFPSHEGCIAKAWYDGEVSVTLPSNHKEYVEYCELELNIKRSDIKNHRMKSRDFFGKAIEDKGGDRVGVIIFESQKPNTLEISAIKDEINTRHSYLSSLILQSKDVNLLVVYKKEITNEQA